MKSYGLEITLSGMKAWINHKSGPNNDRLEGALWAPWQPHILVWNSSLWLTVHFSCVLWWWHLSGPISWTPCESHTETRHSLHNTNRVSNIKDEDIITANYNFITTAVQLADGRTNEETNEQKSNQARGRNMNIADWMAARSVDTRKTSETETCSAKGDNDKFVLSPRGRSLTPGIRPA